MKKLLLTLIASICMAAAAFGQEETYVSDADELSYAISDFFVTKINLTSDINDCYSATIERDLTINLNGHTLSGGEFQFHIGTGTLTINGAGVNCNGTINCVNTGTQIFNVASILILNDVNIIVNYDYAILGEGTVNIGPNVCISGYTEEAIPGPNVNYGDYNCTVTSTNVVKTTGYFSDFKKAADAANSIEGGALITLNADVSGISSTVALGSADGVMLDMNGHSILGDIDLNDDIAYADAIIYVGSGKKLNIVSYSVNNVIGNDGTNGTGIYNEGELSLFGAGVEAKHIGIENNGGTLTLNQSKISALGPTTANAIAVLNTAGSVNVTSSIFTATDSRQCFGIDNHDELTLNDRQTFSISGNNAFDIAICDEGYIGFGKDFGAEQDYSINVFIPEVNTDKCTFTKGYAEKVIDANDEVIDPDNVFSVKYSPSYGNYERACVALEDGEVVAYPAAYVTIGESMRGYGSFSNALAAASNAEEAATIKLMKDFGTADFGGTACSIGSQAGITLNLNGHTMSNDIGDREAFSVDNGHKLTVCDTSGGGVLCNRGSDATVILNRGSLTIDGGTISCGNPDQTDNGYCSAIRSYGSGNVTINGGTIETNGEGSFCIVQADGNVKLNTCPTFKGVGRQSDIHFIGDGRIEPSSEFAATLTKPVAVSTTNDLPFTFTNDYRRNLEDENGHLIAPDKLFTVSHYNNSTFDDCPVAFDRGEATAYSPGTVAIVSSAGVSTEYSNFAAAVSAANSAKDGNDQSVAATFTLIADYNSVLQQGTTMGSASGVTLDLCGHAIDGECDFGLFIVESGKTLTITSSCTGGSITNNTNNTTSSVFHVLGTLNINGGTCHSNNGLNVVESESTAIVNLNTCMIRATGDNTRGILNKGTLNVGSDVVFSIDGPASYGIVTIGGPVCFSALPSFIHAGEGNTDIYLGTSAKIGFGTDIIVPDGNAKIKVHVGSNTLPYAFTTGYAAHVKRSGGATVAPADLFSVTYYDGATDTNLDGVATLIDGEAKAFANAEEAFIAAAVATVTTSDATNYYATFADAANAANAAGAATVTLLADVSDVSSTVTLGSAAGVTLDLNGHSIEGSDADISLIVNGTMTLTDSRTGGTISSSNVTAIYNDGTLNVSGGTISNSTGNAIDNHGTLNVSGGTISGHPGISNNNVGTLTVGAGTTISGSSACIDSGGTLTLNALPTFGGADNRNADIWLGTGAKIGFANGFNVPGDDTKIKVCVNDNQMPYVFTEDYAGNADLFTVTYFDAVSNFYRTAYVNNSVNGEAVAYATAANVTFAPEGYATCYDSKNALLLPVGMKAYVVTGNGEPDADGVSTLTYEPIADGSVEGGNLVPAATAVLLQKATTAETTYVTASTTATYDGTNLLHGSDKAITAEDMAAKEPDGSKFYKLTYGPSEGDALGWYYGAEGGAAFQSGHNKAWLALPANTLARFLALPGFDEASGIDAATASHAGNAADWFTLDGRHLSAQPAKAGIYLRGGKKVAIK